LLGPDLWKSDADHIRSLLIERMIGKSEPDTLRNLLYDAEDYVIGLQSGQARAVLKDQWSAPMKEQSASASDPEFLF
jgi:hypothetical protein